MSPSARSLKSFKVEHWIVAVLLFVMCCITFANVLSRYLLHFSFAATEEITINLFVWMTVVGSGIAFSRGAHLGMVTLFKLFPASVRRGLILFGAGLSTLLFLLVNLYLIRTIYDELVLFHATSGALGVPVWVYYAGVPVLSVFVFKGIYRGTMARLKEEREERRSE
ncbi:MAG: TRAP transporter small permease [Syntrophobacteraceae bacterium]